MPAAFGPDHHIGIGADGDGLRILLDVADDLDIVEVREDEFLGPFQRPEAETAPEIDQALLRMAVELCGSPSSGKA